MCIRDRTEKYWTKFSLYSKAKLAILAYRNGNKALSQAILKSLKENGWKTGEIGTASYTHLDLYKRPV